MNKNQKIEKLEKEIAQTKKNIDIIIFFLLIGLGTFFYGLIGGILGFLLAFLIDYLHRPIVKSNKILNKVIILDDSNGIFRTIKFISENKYEIQEIFSIAGTHINIHIYEYKLEGGEIFSRLISLVKGGFREVDKNIILKDKIKEKYNDEIFSDFSQDYKDKILNLENKILWHKENDEKIYNILVNL